MRTDVVSIYCCGTGGHRGKHAKWAVPHLYDTTKGERKFICDGPGGAKIPKVEDILKKVESGGKVKKKLFEKTHSKGMRKQASGEGTADNIILCLQWLWLEYYKERFVDINLIGWSRGAVTCIMLSHSIQSAGFTELNPNIRVNVFAFDPVPGSKNDFAVKGTFESTGRTGTPDELAPCVASYESILHEKIKKYLKGPIKKDKNFVCAVPSYTGHNQHRTPQVTYPMPGGHGDSGKYNESEGGGPIGRIGIHLAQDFMTRHGTEYTVNHLRTNTELCEDYAQVRLAYTEKGSMAKKAPSQYRKDVVKNAFRDDDFYINHHHHGLVEQTFPHLAAHLAGNGQMGVKELGQLAWCSPSSYAVLKNLGKVN